LNRRITDIRIIWLLFFSTLPLSAISTTSTAGAAVATCGDGLCWRSWGVILDPLLNAVLFDLLPCLIRYEDETVGFRAMVKDELESIRLERVRGVLFERREWYLSENEL
jgi:hypothetical protein